MKIVIDKRIVPIPLKKRKEHKTLYPFSTLKINQSFYIPFKTEKEAFRVMKNLIVAIVAYKKKGALKKSSKFTTRTIAKKKIVRVWRIK